MVQMIIYYTCFVVSIIAFILTFRLDGVAETIVGATINVCCSIVLFFRALYMHTVYEAVRHKVELKTWIIYLGLSPIHALITIISTVVFITNATYLCISYPSLFNISLQTIYLIFCLILYVVIIRSKWE
jgi:hypothetical protein